MKEIRNLFCLIIFVVCIVLSFKGFPFGIVSYIGFLTGVGGWTAAIAAICHPMGSKTNRRLITIFLGFAFASLGRAIVYWGGLVGFNLGTFSIEIASLSAVIGILSGLFNLDKNMQDPTTVKTGKREDKE